MAVTRSVCLATEDKVYKKVVHCRKWNMYRVKFSKPLY